MPESCPAEVVIAAYVNHVATPEERRRAEAHLSECDECCELVAFLVHCPETKPTGLDGESSEPEASPIVLRAETFLKK